MLGPRGAAIGTGKNLRIVADGPTVLIINEKHRREQLPGGYFGLGPGVALVIGIKDMPPITDRHQALARVNHVDHQAFGGLGGFNCKDCGGGGIAGGQNRQRQCAASKQRERCGQQRNPACGAWAANNPTHDRLTHRPFSHLLLLGRLLCQDLETCNLERLEEAGAILSGFGIV